MSYKCSKRRLGFFSYLLAMLILVSCVPFATQSGSQGPIPSVSEEADQAYDRGDYRTAAAGYKRLLEQDPASPRRETLLGMYGLSSERAGDYLQAAQAYQSLVNQYPTGDYSKTVKLRIPDLYILANRAGEALSLSENMYNYETDPASKAALKLSSGRSQYIQGRYRDALVSFIMAMTGAKSAVKEEAKRGLEASLLNLSSSDLTEVQRQYGQNYPGPEASWYLARQAALAGNETLFNEQAEYFKRYFSSHPWVSKLEALRVSPGSPEAAAPGAGYDPRPVLASAVSINRNLGQMSGLKGRAVIGALLPLSNPDSARFSQDIMTGLKLSLSHLSPKVTVEAMDTAGDPTQVVRLVSEASARPEVLALVGPLTSREALAAAQTSQITNIPVITISQRQGITTGRSMVFRIFLTPKHQAEAVARYAVKVLNLTQLGVLYPADQYGQTMYGFFRSEAQRLGVQITSTDSYDPKQRNYTDPVNRLTGGQSIRRASTSYQAQVGFQALYVPDSASAINQILPLMAYNDVTKMVYLGSSIWLTPDLARNAGRYLSGAVIPDAFNSLSERAQAVRFRDAFQKATGRNADLFAAYGYDAGVALSSAIEAGAGSRHELVNALLTIKPFDGATGPFSFDQEGDYQVEPLMVTIDGTSFKLLAEPTQFR
ncbi:MAG: ABC transporter substrate-binding protein [Deltaproteobacteria bacterium]|jgi:ABC-type branched-subunit amino acid transport system substrate-binding protein|nr:ABC transporter substrate-binding protein [Deltaproteobacteria bacterium]